jgi:hypothetical protein
MPGNNVVNIFLLAPGGPRLFRLLPRFTWLHFGCPRIHAYLCRSISLSIYIACKSDVVCASSPYNFNENSNVRNTPPLKSPTKDRIYNPLG